jgi:hypothetical protein
LSIEENPLRIITGMHRSGTSLIAQLFYRAGADMGDPDTFYRPDRWNPEGYFEQPTIHAINMPLINGMWGKLAYFRLPSTETILRRAERREEQIKNTASQYEGKVIKETRFCLTLPAWLKYGATVNKVLICLREPIDATIPPGSMVTTSGLNTIRGFSRTRSGPTSRYGSSNTIVCLIPTPTMWRWERPFAF